MFLCLNVLMFSKQFILTWTAFLSFNYAKNRSARCQKPEAVCQKPEGIMPKTGNDASKFSTAPPAGIARNMLVLRESVARGRGDAWALHFRKP
jgi:hypothetical protein